MSIIILVIKNMEKKNWIYVIATCVIVFGMLANMSLAREPSVPQAGDIIEVLGEITMPGSAQMETKPDLCVISLSIQVLDKDSAVSAKNRVAQIIDRVIQALRQLGLDDDDIETMGYNIEQVYEWENDVRVFKGYRVTCTMKVTVKDFDKAGKVIDASVDAGAFVESINFELSKQKEESLKLQLLTEATKDAKKKAEIVMSALGQHLGRATSVRVESSYQPYQYWKTVSDSAGESVNAPPTTIMQKDLTVSATVTIVFEILP
jgi:hypothetical protein